MHTRPQTLVALAASAVLWAGVCTAGAQSERIELAEARAALAAALDQNRKLSAEVNRLSTVNRNLGASLRVANAEAEDFRNAYADMRLQMEALGLETVTDGTRGIEGRMAKAVRDISLLETQKGELRDALIGLSDAALHFVGTVVEPNAAAAADVQTAIASADEALGMGTKIERAPQATGTLHSSRIVSVKKDFGVVVLNVGREHGVRIGMPFEVRRVDRPIGSLLIVDVRDNISAALVQQLADANDPPRVTDTATISTTE
jgi:hypothetical protein